MSNIDFLTRLYVVGKDEFYVDLNKYRDLFMNCYFYDTPVSDGYRKVELSVSKDTVVKCNPDPQLFYIESHKRNLNGKVVFDVCGKKVFLNLMGSTGKIDISIQVPKERIRISEDDIIIMKIGTEELKNREKPEINVDNKFYIHRYKATLGKMKELFRFEKYVKNTLPWNQEYGVKGFFKLLALLPNTNLSSNFKVMDINFTTGVSDVSIVVNAQSPQGLKEFIETVEKLAEITGVIVKPVTSLRIPIK